MKCQNCNDGELRVISRWQYSDIYGCNKCGWTSFRGWIVGDKKT